MKNSDIVVSPELEVLVAENSKLWAKYDATRQDCATFQSLSSGVAMSGDVKNVGRLTSDEDVPNEINAIIRELRSDQETLKTLGLQIQSKTTEIDTIRRHATNMRILIGTVVIILVLLAALYLFQFMR